MFLQFNLSTAIIIIMLINLKITFLDAIQNGNDMQYDIEVIRHNPCHYIKGLLFILLMNKKKKIIISKLYHLLI